MTLHRRLTESRSVIHLDLDIPEDILDKEYPLDRFAARVRELAILELVRIKRMHEHEALQLLGIERRELLEKMAASGIVPTEDAFEAIKGELDRAIQTRTQK